MLTTHIQTFGPSFVMYRFELTYADFQAGTLTSTNHISTVTLLSTTGLSLGSLVLAVRMKHETAFAGGSVSAATCSVGSAAGSATTFAAAFNCFQAVAATTFQAAAATNLAATYSADTLQAVLTLTSDVMANLTAGDIIIDVVMFQFPNLAAGIAPFGNPPFSTTAGGFGS